MEYGNGITMAQAFAYDRERIQHALKGELMSGENEQGFKYAPADEKLCKEFILRAFDQAAYLAIDANRTGVAIERICSKKGINISLQEFMAEKLKIERADGEVDSDEGIDPRRGDDALKEKLP